MMCFDISCIQRVIAADYLGNLNNGTAWAALRSGTVQLSDQEAI
jgi:hypothetical protein